MSPPNPRIMSSTLLPFLYQTRTLRRAFAVFGAPSLARLVHTPRRSKAKKPDNSIPFVWEPSDPNAPQETSTITPSEAQIFKSIFDEIAQGKMPAAKKQPPPSRHASRGARAAVASKVEAGGLDSDLWSNQDMKGRSPVEQARVTEFRERILRRYPESLRNAAQVALGLFELKPDGSEEAAAGPRMVEMDGGNQRKWKENERYDLARSQELDRVEALMAVCETDEELWRVVEREVFSLPAKLGILEGPEEADSVEENEEQAGAELAGARSEQSLVGDVASEQQQHQQHQQHQPTSITENAEEKRIMDIHGPLYSQFISTALRLFETAFAHPSPYVFQILPRVKALGLPSYVLGMSAPFYRRLAQIHWLRFGDAHAAIDVLREMNAVGLYADRETRTLLRTIREQLIGCAWGGQGPVVMAMTEAPPYDSALMQKLDALEKTVRRSLRDRALI